MTGLYMDKGYIYVNIQPLQTPSSEDVVDIKFEILENQKVFVRNVNIYGNTKTKEKVIRRELKLFPGEVFNRTKLIRSQREIFILNYFSNVIPNISPVDDDEVDVEISVEEKRSDLVRLREVVVRDENSVEEPELGELLIGKAEIVLDSGHDA